MSRLESCSSFCQHLSAKSFWIFLAAATTLASAQTSFFLPQNPVAAAYVLGRLSNSELIEAPRSEYVYVALLQRKGLDKKYRLEALDGLAKLRHTNTLTELVRSITDLDKKGEESEGSLHDLGALLLQMPRSDLNARREQFEPLTQRAQLALTRQVAFATCLVATGSPEPLWSKCKANPSQMPDLVLAIPLISDPALRMEFYARLKPLLLVSDPPELRRAAIASIVSIPGHDVETFQALASFVRQGTEIPTAIVGLERLPHDALPRDQLKPLADALVIYLQKIPTEQRTDAVFDQVLQFATDLVSLLPADAQRSLSRILRGLGPIAVTLHAIYEQMRFDKDAIVVEAGKPVVITLQNDDAMPHNLAILAPGSLKEIGLAAEKMPPEPDSQGRLYVPASPKILQATRLVSPGQKLRLAFDAPAEAGDYPFACTFPGHWLRMAGTLTVVLDLDAYLASHASVQAPKLTDWKMADFSAEWSQVDQGRNLAAGQELFSKLACIQCHKLGSNGYTYGPDLTDVFKRYKNDRPAVLQQILDPSKVIADRYRNFNFDLKTGDPVLGVVLKEDDQTVTIQTGPADSLIQSLKKSEIQQRRAQSSSPMPVGLLSGLSKAQILDLLAFLESGGGPPTHEHHH